MRIFPPPSRSSLNQEGTRFCMEVEAGGGLGRALGLYFSRELKAPSVFFVPESFRIRFQIASTDFLPTRYLGSGSIHSMRCRTHVSSGRMGLLSHLRVSRITSPRL